MERADGTTHSVSSMLSASSSASTSASTPPRWPLYSGVVLGNAGSSADGVLHDNGLFSGAMRLASGETFYVERRELFAQDLNKLDQAGAQVNTRQGHSVIYSSRNVNTARLVLL